MSVTVVTSRGAYRLAIGDVVVSFDRAISFTATLERSDGIERVAFRCTIDRALTDALKDEAAVHAIEQHFAAWLGREFEQTREST